MKKFILPIICLLLVMSLNGCAAIEGIFKAGAVVGIIAVVVVIGIILWIISMFRNKN